VNRGNSLEFVILDLFGIWRLEFVLDFVLRVSDLFLNTASKTIQRLTIFEHHQGDSPLETPPLTLPSPR